MSVIVVLVAGGFGDGRGFCCEADGSTAGVRDDDAGRSGVSEGVDRIDPERAKECLKDPNTVLPDETIDRQRTITLVESASEPHVAHCLGS